MASAHTLDTVLSALKDKGFRLTAQRRAIVAEVLRAKGHINPTAIVRRVRDSVEVDPSTVYRTLAMLDEVGVLSHAHLENGVEYHRSEQPPHVHLTCRRCGKKTSLPMKEVEPLARAMQREHGFLPDLTHFAIAGLCRRCQARGPSA